MQPPTAPLPIIPLSRKSRICSADLELIRNHLGTNTLAIQYVPDMLKYANSLLCASEQHCRTPYDQARAQVHYGNTTFLFSRMATTTAKDH
jgi:hypothetical protein